MLKHAIGQLMLAAGLLAAGIEIAEASVTSTIGAGVRGTQQGRLSRNGIPQDWAGDEFRDAGVPATINPTVTYYFTTYQVNVGSLNYLDIIFDSLSANTFLSVYQGSNFNPLNLQQNLLGDPGTSGDYFGTDALFVDVVAALNSAVTLVVTTTNGGTSALRDPFTLSVFAYPDSDYSADPVELQATRVPEPSTVLLLIAPLVALGGRRLQQRSKKHSLSLDGLAA